MLCDSFIKRSPLCLFSLTVVEMFASKTARMNPNGSTWGKSQEIDGSLPTSKDEGKLWLACGTRRKSKRYARISIWQVCLHSQVQQRKPAGTKTEKKQIHFVRSLDQYVSPSVNFLFDLSTSAVHWPLCWVLLPARPTAHFGATLGLKTTFSKRSTAPVQLKEDANTPLVLQAPGHSQLAEWFTEITSWASVAAAVKLWKGFVDYETSPDSKSARGWAECDWIFISGWV